MANLTDSNDERNGAAPIGAHPAFSAIVAMWFAVLLGLGTLVLPAAWLERLVLASGIASLAPAAHPPLDMTARTLIAIVAAAVGALAGFAAARRIAAPYTDAGDRPGERVPRPLSASEELGDLLDWAEPDVPGRETLAEWVEPAPARREEPSETSDLAQLVERLGLAIERHRARPAAMNPAVAAAPAKALEPAPVAYVSDTTETALRAALERLRQLREAA